jgi:acetyltransferase-like isoleucine patch superfamily enzyme
MKEKMKEKINSPQYDYSNLNSCGNDVFISSNVEIRRPKLIEIGNHVAIDTGFYMTTGGKIGDYIHIGPYITVIGGPNSVFIMEDFTTVAAGCRIICGSDDHLGAGFVGPTIPEKYRDDVKIAPVIMKMFSSLGTNVVVLPGVTLAEGSVVGACSLVTKDTEPWTIYAGVPAKPIKKREKDNMIKYATELGYIK